MLKIKPMHHRHKTFRKKTTAPQWEQCWYNLFKQVITFCSEDMLPVLCQGQDRAKDAPCPCQITISRVIFKRNKSNSSLFNVSSSNLCLRHILLTSHMCVMDVMILTWFNDIKSQSSARIGLLFI